MQPVEQRRIRDHDRILAGVDGAAATRAGLCGPARVTAERSGSVRGSAVRVASQRARYSAFARARQDGRSAATVTAARHASGVVRHVSLTAVAPRTCSALRAPLAAVLVGARASCRAADDQAADAQPDEPRTTCHPATPNAWLDCHADGIPWLRQ